MSIVSVYHILYPFIQQWTCGLRPPFGYECCTITYLILTLFLVHWLCAVAGLLQDIIRILLVSNHSKYLLSLSMVKMLLPEFFILITISEVVTIIMIFSFTNDKTEAQRDKVTSPELLFSEKKESRLKASQSDMNLHPNTSHDLSCQWPGKNQYIDTPWALGSPFYKAHQHMLMWSNEDNKLLWSLFPIQNLTDIHCLWSSQYWGQSYCV